MWSVFRVLLLLLIPIGAFARDVFLPIAGSPRTFRTDVSLFNTSGNAQSVTATFLPAGRDNTSASGVSIAVPSRQMVMISDIMRTRFNISDSSAIGAIRFNTAGDTDDLVVMGRIYSNSMMGSTGQFVPGLEAEEAELKGILLQLKATGEIGTTGTFRTNLGFMNPNSTAATVTVRLYDKNNGLVGGPITRSIPPMSVDFPSRTDMTLQLSAAAADFSNAWASFDSNVPVFGFASVVDNGTAETFLIVADRDSGSTAPPQPSTRTFNITARNWRFDVAEGPIRVKEGDNVVLRVTSTQGLHGFAIESIRPTPVNIPQGQTREFSFTAPSVGEVTTFTYFCTEFCGEGHATMQGILTVEPRTGDRGPGY